MGRPPTKPAKLKDGYYIEVRNEGSRTSGIKIRRDTREEIVLAIRNYSRIKDVVVLGELKNDKWVDKAEDLKKYQ
ncbi:MAG: hypothetical protein JJT77_10665 [Crocinitomicaceae bacterium]|nr:hypothetical protein [Crocinitomicaceae bacterium]